MPLKPPPHPEPIKAGLERFGVYGTRWAAGLVVGGLLLWASQTGRAPSPALPKDDLPVQQWAADAIPHVLSSVAAGALPAPDPRQRKPPCDPDLEREINGHCWIPVDVKPCPKGKAFLHDDGRCYAYALRAERLPTTGEPRPGNVAGGAQ